MTLSQIQSLLLFGRVIATFESGYPPTSQFRWFEHNGESYRLREGDTLIEYEGMMYIINAKEAVPK